MADSLAQAFASNAVLFPHMLELISDRILMSHLTEENFNTASFLDQRMFTPQLKRNLLEWSDVENIPLPSAPTPYYIFHIGHVGSTLISRLLGEWSNILALREPLILRNLAEIWQTLDAPHSRWSPEQYAARRDLITRWLSRSFHDEQRPMVKASSFVSPLAPQLIKSDTKALFLKTNLESYMLTILAGEASMHETMAMAPARLERLTATLNEPPARLWELTPAQRVAMSWLCEMVTLHRAEKTAPTGSVKWQDFDRFLAMPNAQLTEIAEFFDLSVEQPLVSALLQGPIMRSYSKAPEHGYSADLRRDVQNEAKMRHGGELKTAMKWVEKLANRHSAIADICNFNP
ncbi:hypothetical protein ACFOWX_10605 [Sphingorhabdus arenilitoris]|uniref:Sulfotransferase family protein n=1 Tax=Sphingorhabdus arenilitoris TaxID=1490041 RepID=A0ABV8RHJ5_9SPHN